MNQLFVQIVKKAEKDFVIQYISTDKKTWYLLPEESKDLKCHTILSSKKPILNAMYAIKNINGYRTIAVKIEDDIQKEYFYESLNICFKELQLEECVSNKLPSRSIEPL
uniref:Uncharacterized protein n=2 Tax=Cuerna arida TaxID=1464854 RepID=A0A1B6EXN1_9HEMI